MPKFLTTEQNRIIAYHYTAPENENLPTVVFLGGFMSDMQGSKATALEKTCRARGQGYLRFDYSGHGESEGKFTEGTIGTWAEDALNVINEITKGSLVLAGSSMGGWISLLVAPRLGDRVMGIVGIAAGPDFTEDLRFSQLTREQLQEIDDRGLCYIPSDYDAPYAITKTLLIDGHHQSVLKKQIEITCPVRLVQGTEDTIVADTKPDAIKNALATDDVVIEFIDGGNHSLSRPSDIEIIDGYICELSGIEEPLKRKTHKA